MPHKYDKCTRQGQIKKSLNQQDLEIFFLVVCRKTVIPLALVGSDEMIMPSRI